jgi:hypothetical protein
MRLAQRDCESQTELRQEHVGHFDSKFIYRARWLNTR